MSITLQDFANGDTNYISKHNSNNATLESTINSILAALSTSGSGAASLSNLLAALFGNLTAFIDSTSYAASTSGTTLTLSAGYAWRPDLGNVLHCATPTALNFAGQAAATYYITLGADGTPAIATSSTFALYSVVWTGSAFGTITAVAPSIPGGDVGGTFESLVIAAAAVTLAKMADLAANSVIGNNTASPATPIALPLGGANGVASLDSSGKVPSSQLPASVAGALNYQGTWNASTNTPALASGTGSKGFYYKVSVAGTTALDGISDWAVGDSVVFDGSTWDKINGADPEVLSVAGKTGAVTLAVADVSGAAPLASPAFTGTPAAPTPTTTDNSTKIATTAFVQSALAGGGGGTIIALSPYFYGGITKPVAASFTLNNGSGVTGGALADLATRGTILSMTSGGGSGIQAQEVAVPSQTAFTVIALLYLSAPLGPGSWSVGVCVKDSTGKYTQWGWRNNSGVGIPSMFDFNSISSFADTTNFGTWQPQSINGPVWIKLQLTGGNFVTSISIDGEYWTQIDSRSKTSFLGSTLSTVGLLAFNNSGNAFALSCYSFTATTP